MKRYLLPSITIGFALCSVMCIGVWIASYKLTVSFTWASGSTHYQVSSYRGAIFVALNRKWWRNEPLVITYDANPGTSRITHWPGMRIEHESSCLGFERATGEWVSPFMSGGNGHFKPRTMRYTITPIGIIGIPYWSISLALVANAVGAILVWHRRRDQQQADCQTTTLVLLPTTR